MSAQEKRFPSSVYGAGDEPDARFSLANERTFLAWIRTALACIAAALAIEALGAPEHDGLRLAATVVLGVGGLGAAAQAWRGWARTERALRTGDPLPSSGLKLPIALAMAAVAIIAILGLVT